MYVISEISSKRSFPVIKIPSSPPVYLNHSVMKGRHCYSQWECNLSIQYYNKLIQQWLIIKVKMSYLWRHSREESQDISTLRTYFTIFLMISEHIIWLYRYRPWRRSWTIEWTIDRITCKCNIERLSNPTSLWLLKIAIKNNIQVSRFVNTEVADMFIVIHNILIITRLKI